MKSKNIQGKSQTTKPIIDGNFLLASKGKTFYWARFLLTKRHAQRATRLYRFCRFLDDLVDETEDIRVSKLVINQLRDDLMNSYSKDPLVADAIDLFNECNINSDVVMSLMNGIESDLSLVRMHNLDSLLRYCYQVAGTVGLMMCKVLDVTDAKAYPYAIDLGIAMQLTNICRDVSDDATLNRLYLPKTMVGDLDVNACINPSAEQALKLQEIVAELLKIADSYYLSGNNGLAFITLRARLGILIASKLYQEIGVKLMKQQYRFWMKRACLTIKDKLLSTVIIMILALFSLRFWSVIKTHDKQLHHSLYLLPYADNP